jgi:hypothetical protein
MGSGIRALAAAAVAVPVVMAVGSCSQAAHSQQRHPTSAASASVPTPVSSPSPAGAAVPTPTGVPSARSLTHVGQALVLAGAVSGTVSSAEVKQCGSYGGQWSLQMSNMAIGGSTVSMSLYVDSYTTPGSYAPRGSLMVIRNQQSTFYSLAFGTIQMQSVAAGRVDLTFQGQGNLNVTGSWACAG